MTLNFQNLLRGALSLLVILVSCKSAELGTSVEPADARLQAEARVDRLLDGAQFAGALAAAESLISAGGKDPRVLGGKARALAGLRRSEEAIAAFEEAILMDYEDCENHMHFATYLMRLGKTGRAHTEFMEAKRFCDARHAPLIYRNLAVSGIKLSKLDAARKYVDEGLESNPSDSYLSGLKGMLIARENPLAAESLFVKSQGGGDATGDFLFQYGLLLINEGRPVEAIQALEKALRKRPGDREIRVNLAEALDRALRYGEAEAVLRQLLAEKEEEEIWEKLAGVLFHKKSYEEALQLYRNLRQSPEVMDKIAMCLSNLGRPDEALPWSRKALAARPDWPQGMINLAVVLAAKGELGEAARLLERALTIEPGNATARVNLDRLRDALGK